MNVVPCSSLGPAVLSAFWWGTIRLSCAAVGGGLQGVRMALDLGRNYVVSS